MKIVPNLWFDRQAEEAAHFYVQTFKHSRVERVTRASKIGFDIHGVPAGTVLTVDFEIEDHPFVAINGGPLFTFNPAISFVVACRSKDEVDALWNRLLDHGSALMQLGAYPFSERYGWLNDRYGLSWQLMFVGDRPIAQKIIPMLMFVGAQCGNAEAAIKLYTETFAGSAIDDVARHQPGTAPDRAGTIRLSHFTLAGQKFAAMDSAHDHAFAFNEAVSLLIECRDQEEIDRYWERLVRDGGQESQCGWLKDRFGVSWQVSPTRLRDMLLDPDPARVERVTAAFLKMTKFDLRALETAFNG